mgnify:CR=1 FL=1
MLIFNKDNILEALEKQIMKFVDIIKNLSYSFSVNLFSALISILMIFLLPKVMSVEEYGAWQLYLFCLSYVGFFPLGWIDGIYLRYGGKKYNELDKNVFAGQFYALAFVEMVVALVFIFYAKFGVEEQFNSDVIKTVSIVGVFVILTAFSSFILQITNRIKDYAKLVIYERALFFFLILAYVAMGFSGYKGLLFISLATRFLAFIFGCFLVKEIVCSKVTGFATTFGEMHANISAGIKLMFANIAGMLLIGIIRFGISQEWDVVTFGKVSLTLGVSNFMIVFISAVSVVLFPILKRINQERLPEIYIVLRNCLSVLLLGLLIFYYPLKSLLIIWLPKYADSLIYMAVLLPVCLFESKVSMLINTYLKSLRQEKLMLRINWIAVIVSVSTTMITVWLLHNLELAIMSIVLVFAFRCVLAEYFLSELLKIELRKDILLELGMVCLFVTVSWFIDSWLCTLIYSCGYAIYLFVKKDDIGALMKTMREVI